MPTREKSDSSDSWPGSRFFSKYHHYIIVALLGICLAVAVYVNLVYGTDTIYTHFFYLPIILAAVWYPRKALYLAALLGLFHIGLGIINTGTIIPSTIVRAISFLVIALVTVSLSGIREQLYHRVEISEGKLRSIFNGVFDAIFIHDVDGRIIDVNDRMLELYGVTRDEATVLSIERDYSSPENPVGQLPEIWNKVLAGEDLLFDWIARKPADGATFPVEVYLRMIRFGDRDMILATVRDISRRKQAEEERGLLAKNLSQLLESTDEGIFGLNQEGRCTFINRSAAEMIEYGPEELIGGDVHEMIHCKHPDGSPFPKESCRMLGSMKTGEGVRVSNEVFWRKYGTSFPVEYSSNPIRENGRITGAVVSFYDITARKRTERELQDAKKRAEIYIDLLGHDINNFNQKGIGFLEIALEAMKQDDETRSIIRRALDAMKNSSALIQNVRKIQQIQAEKPPHEIIDLGRLLSDLAAEFSRVPGREVTVEYQPVPGCCIEASALIREAFWNLVSNSIKHSEGPVSVWIKVSRSEVKGKPFYRVDVEDNGPGIPDELKRKLFIRKVRGTTRAAGSGLGLFLVKALVDDAGGKVWVEDRVPGDHTKGSRFVVLLPAHPAARKAVEESHADRHQPGHA